MKRASRKVWARRVAAWRKSGQSAREYAGRLGVNHHTLYSWKYKLAREGVVEADLSEPASVSFVEVLPSSALLTSQAEPFELHLEGGHRVVVPAHFDSESLRRLLDVVERRA